MNRDDILNMPAGREMDALVWMALHEQKPDLSFCRFVDGDYQPNAGYPAGHISPPAYSTDIAAAWNIAGNEVDITLHYHLPEKQWYCTIFIEAGRKQVYAQADTAPLAICRAALLAVMEAE